MNTDKPRMQITDKYNMSHLKLTRSNSKTPVKSYLFSEQ